MAESGVDIAGQESTRLTAYLMEWADLVVTVCGHADEHRPGADPPQAKVRSAEEGAGFRAARDEIRDRVAALVERLEG